MPLGQLRQHREVNERGRADAPAHRLRGAIGDEVVAKLALGVLDPDIRFADGRLHALHHLFEVIDHRLHVAHGTGLGGKDDARVRDVDRAIREPLERLRQDAVRLPALLESHEVSVVHVPVLAYGHVEIVCLVVEVRLVLAEIVRHAAGAEHRPGE